MKDLDLALLGPPVITRSGAPVSFDTRKATAVLALLAADHHELSRERLAALLWPDADAVRARASLRRTLSVTAAAAGPGLLVTRTAVALDASRVRVDVTEFEALAAGPDPASWTARSRCTGTTSWPASRCATARSSTTGRPKPRTGSGSGWRAPWTGWSRRAPPRATWTGRPVTRAAGSASTRCTSPRTRR